MPVCQFKADEDSDDKDMDKSQDKKGEDARSVKRPASLLDISHYLLVSSVVALSRQFNFHECAGVFKVRMPTTSIFQFVNRQVHTSRKRSSTPALALGRNNAQSTHMHRDC